jgi:hypothetical protein
MKGVLQAKDKSLSPTRKLAQKVFGDSVKGFKIIVFTPGECGEQMMRALGYMLSADGNTVHILTQKGTHWRELRSIAKARKKGAEWLIARADAEFIGDLQNAGIRPEVTIASPGTSTTITELELTTLRSLRPHLAILSADDDLFEQRARKLQKGTTLVTVGAGRARLQLKAVQQNEQNVSATFISPFGTITTETPMFSAKTVLCLAMAVSAAQELGCSLPAIERGIKTLT